MIYSTKTPSKIRIWVWHPYRPHAPGWAAYTIEKAVRTPTSASPNGLILTLARQSDPHGRDTWFDGKNNIYSELTDQFVLAAKPPRTLKAYKAYLVAQEVISPLELAEVAASHQDENGYWKALFHEASLQETLARIRGIKGTTVMIHGSISSKNAVLDMTGAGPSPTTSSRWFDVHEGLTTEEENLVAALTPPKLGDPSPVGGIWYDEHGMPLDRRCLALLAEGTGFEQTLETIRELQQPAGKKTFRSVCVRR